MLVGTVHSGVQMGMMKIAKESGTLLIIPNAGSMPPMPVALFDLPPHSAARLLLIEGFTPAGKKRHDKAVSASRFDGQWSERHRHC